MSTTASEDPFTVLGISPDASEAEARARYLELVKQFPPDREPEKFRQIRAAYEASSDPLTIASSMIEPPGEEVPEWAEVLAAQKRKPPRFSVPFLLSLGNRTNPANGPSASE